MNRGLALKAIRETWGLTLLFALLLTAVVTLISYVVPTFQSQLSQQMASIPFVQNLVRAFVGAEAADRLGPELFQSLGWVHPVVLALVWAHAIIVATRVPAGEVERGTIDVLLSLPVSRASVAVSESVVWIVSGAVLLCGAAAGCALGSQFVAHDLRQQPERVGMILANLYCLYLCAAGLAWCISAASERRGRALTTTFVILLASFLVNYLAQLWEPARTIIWISVLDYYRPPSIVRDGRFPFAEAATLLTIGGVLWAIGVAVFARRDLAAM